VERLIRDVNATPQPGEDWKSVRRDENVLVWQRKDPEKPIHLIKVSVLF